MSILSRSPSSGRTSICSGAAISSTYVLTSASCILQSSQYELRSASVNFYTGGRVVISREGHAHPEYDQYTQSNNFGLIRVSAINTVSILLLPAVSNVILPGRQTIVSGWGLASNNEISPVLQYTHGNILDSNDQNCKYNFNNMTVNSSRLCATFSGQYRCAGDFGSPLVIQVNRTNYLVGIASLNPRDVRCYNSTTLFSGITPAVREWIGDIVGV